MGKQPRLADYDRHVQVAPWNYRVVERTKGNKNPAVFKTDISPTPDQIAVQLENANPILRPPNEVTRYWRKFEDYIGASDGEETKYVLIKHDCCYVHAYPITPQQLKQKFKVDVYGKN